MSLMSFGVRKFNYGRELALVSREMDAAKIQDGRPDHNLEPFLG